MFKMLLLAIALTAQSTPKGTIPHQATLNYSNPTCTIAKPCAIQVYRAVCPQVTQCPTYPGQSSSFTQLAAGTGVATPTSTGTTWVITDTDTALQDATTYVYYATNSFQSSPAVYSQASAPWSGTTGAAPVSPNAPTNGSGNTIQ
jgi:hypothetical protein